MLQGPLGEEKTRFNPTLAATDHSPAATFLGRCSKDFWAIQGAPKTVLDAACGQRARQNNLPEAPLPWCHRAITACSCNLHKVSPASIPA